MVWGIFLTYTLRKLTIFEQKIIGELLLFFNKNKDFSKQSKTIKILI